MEARYHVVPTETFLLLLCVQTERICQPNIFFTLDSMVLSRSFTSAKPVQFIHSARGEKDTESGEGDVIQGKSILTYTTSYL